MSAGVSHRTHVSYIDKSREYYRAHGYDTPYAWAKHAEVPFAPLARPLAGSRIGVVTTADLGPREAPPESKTYAVPVAGEHVLQTDKSWDREATHTRDGESYLPLASLAAWAADGRIGSVSRRFYGAATDYSQRNTRELDAPRIREWLAEDAVDAAILVPL